MLNHGLKTTKLKLLTGYHPSKFREEMRSYKSQKTSGLCAAGVNWIDSDEQFFAPARCPDGRKKVDVLWRQEKRPSHLDTQ